jgi:sugar phosphate isomerase/epimerase/protein-tyrosine-phosphatase
MAQALFRELAGGAVTVESAGVDPWDDLHPMAVRLMKERGICVDGQFPKPLSSVLKRPFDFVVTIGNPARMLLPKGEFSSAYWMHWDTGDPADADGTSESETVFRSVLAAIEERLPALRRRTASYRRLSEYAGQPGISTHVWASQRFVPSDHLPLVREAGFRAIELNLYHGRDHFDWDDPSAVRALREVADDLGILVWSIHTPDLGSIAAPEASERQRQTDVIRACLELADLLGARAIVSHALLLVPFEDDPEGCEDRIAAFLADFEGEAEASPAQIAFENGFQDTQPSTVSILRRLGGMSRAAYGFALDSGHANIAGDLTDIEEHILDHLVSLHLNDNSGRGKDQHLPPGEGVSDWTQVDRILRASGFRGVMMHEVQSYERDPIDTLRLTMDGHRRYLAEGSL